MSLNEYGNGNDNILIQGDAIQARVMSFFYLGKSFDHFVR